MVTHCDAENTNGGNEPTDRLLMERLTAGDCEALGVLYSRHGAAMRSLIHRLLPSALVDDVQDLCHDAFLILHRTAARYQSERALRPWLLGIAAATARNWRRKSWLRGALFGRQGQAGGPLGSGTVPSPAARLEARQDLRSALAKLPHAQREALVLSVVEGLTAAEISQALGVAEKTVWTRLHRARRSLLEAYRPQAEGDDRR